MKYKWIALVLACALLLCGCRQMLTGGETVITTTKSDTGNCDGAIIGYAKQYL